MIRVYLPVFMTGKKSAIESQCMGILNILMTALPDWEEQLVRCHLLDALGSENAMLLETSAFSLLHNWDGALSAKSPGAAILKVIEAHLLILIAQRLFADQEGLVNNWLGIGHTPLAASTMSHWRMHEILAAIVRSQTRLATIKSPDDWSSLFQQAFTQAIVELQSLQGREPTKWAWGRLHRLEISHILVQQPSYKERPVFLRLLKGIFKLSRGPFDIGGDEHTPWQTSFFPVPLFAQTHPRRFWATAYQPSWRMIAADNGKLYACLPGGVSEHPKHQWSDNQLSAYINGNLYELKV